MKKLGLSALLFILSIVNSYPQWTNQNPVPNGNDLWSTFFIDENTGWIVGSDGFIKKTTNAGIDWMQQNSGTDLILKTVQFIDQYTGWVCGEAGLILKTTDGGQNWFNQTSGTTEHLTDINFSDVNTGYAVGFSGTILKTIDGGLSWITQSSGTSRDLYDVDFVDVLVGYTVGGEYAHWKLLKTTNGGDSWVDMSGNIPFTYGYAFTVKFIDENTGFIGGGHAPHYNRIYKTTNGGNTWVQLTIGTYLNKGEENNRELLCTYKSGGINSIFFKDSNTGYAVAGDGGGFYRAIYSTTDGGSTWNDKYVGEEESGLFAIYVTNTGKGWAVGFNGAIFISEYNGNSWTQILSGNRYSCWTGDDLYSVFSINENNIWAAGYRASCIGGGGNVILKTTDGGKVWKTKFLNQYNGGTIKTIYFANEYLGWAVGEGTTGFYLTTDGGENWTESFDRYSSVFFIDQYTGWATKGGYYNGIFKSTDGGLTWNQKSSISSTNVYFSDMNTGWVVGENGNILKSADGGESWVAKASGTANNLNFIKFYDLNVGVCVGDAGTILLSADGGESWVPQIAGTTSNLKAITFTNLTSVWITGANGTILSTTDLGTNWTLHTEVTENDLTSLCFINENTGWIGGMNGSMFKYYNDLVPVELMSFTANVIDNTVKLDWETATEINNYGFEIERCSEAEKWNRIGFVDGHGNSSISNSYSFIDRNTVGSNKYNYRLKQLDFDGSFEYSNVVEVEVMPAYFQLSQNYPNPFNPVTKITYQIPKESKVVIKVYDILGAEVASLVDETKEVGYYEIELNGINLPSGTYIYRITAGDFIEAKKMVLMK